MEDDKPKHCVQIKNSRVRRMLNMDNAEAYGLNPKSERNTTDSISKESSCNLAIPFCSSKNGTLTLQGCPANQQKVGEKRMKPLYKNQRGWRMLNMDNAEDFGFNTTKRNTDLIAQNTSCNLAMPSYSSKNETVTFTGGTAKQTKVDGKPMKPPKKKPRVRRILNLNNVDDYGYTKINTDDDGTQSSNVPEPYIRVDNEKSCEEPALENVGQNFTKNSDEELEPFSPVVSEYFPGSDSYESDENIPSKNICERRRKRKIRNHQDPQYDRTTMLLTTSEPQAYTSSQLNLISINPLLDENPKFAINLEAGTPNPNSSHTGSYSGTPCSSLVVFKKITTPDSFKEVLRTVKHKHTFNKPDYFDCTTDTDQLKDKQVICMTAKRNQNCPSTKVYYEQFHFVASTSTVYINCDVTRKQVEQDDGLLISTEMDNTINNKSNEQSAISDQNVLLPSQIPNMTVRQSIEINFIATQSTVYVNDQNGIDDDDKEQTSAKRLSRKRVRDETSWRVNKNKLLKNSGKRYHSKATKIERRGKVLGDPCVCKNKCTEKIDNSERKLAFESYWQLASHERQWDYILRYVKGKPTRVAVVNSKRPRTQTLIYSLPKKDGRNTVTVCKKMFLQTFDINDKIVYTALEKQENHQVVDLRGNHSNRPNKINENTTKSVVDHINMFPRKESHYLRKQTQREYLDEKLNCAKMHRLYLDWIKNNPEFENVMPASERWYYHIFNTRFNIGFFQPKKDLCETCSLYDQADSEKKEKLKEDFEKHIKNKELIRQIKNKEKEESNDKEKTVACFDLEKVLSLPQSEVGVFHYKRKYPVYNFTIYNILTKSGHCFVWHAQIAKRGANEIASCLWCFLQTEAEKGIKEISFYSDNCTGQNRNRFVFALYIYASKALGTKITHRFLQKGHTQNEGDSMHSCIEKSKKNHVLYVPDEIYAIIRNAKVQGQKYKVKEMTQVDFFNFKNLVDDTKNWEKDDLGKKVSWIKIKEIITDPQSPGKLRIRYEFDDRAPIITVDTNRSGRVGRKRKTAATEGPIILQKLYDAPLPINANLYKDLMSLCKENHIPPHYQVFYNSLSIQSAANVSDPGEEDDEV